jgi:hypothetical protein
VSQEKWYNQADWLKTSVNRNPYYLALTMMKLKFLQETKNKSGSSYYYWVDSGIFNSYGIPEDINSFYFTKIPKEKFFTTSFNYNADKEIHGFNIDVMTEMCNGIRPNYVCRSTLFGGSKYQIDVASELFYSILDEAIKRETIGTEESIYTIMSHRFPIFFTRHNMSTGNIYEFLRTIKK